MSKLLFATILALILFSIVLAAFNQKRAWIVPDDAKQRKNPLIATDSNLYSAHTLYLDNCSNCHGQTGKGDGPEARQHSTRPADFSDPNRMSSVTDGELFYKISGGHRPMPGFQHRLTEDQRWQLVLLLRHFAQPQNPPKASP